MLANRFIYHFKDPERGDIVVFETPLAARQRCGAGGTFVKRIIGLPGERVELRSERSSTYVYINGRRLEEPYIDRHAPRHTAAADLPGAARASTS